MLATITKNLRDFLAAQSVALKCKAGRAADREGALLWLMHHTGSSWGVCVCIAGVAPAGTVLERREGRAEVTVRLVLGLTPGAPEDADRRAEELHLAWHLVWSYMMRVRWGMAREGNDGRVEFLPRDGFLDGNRPMLPAGTAQFTRERLQAVGYDGKKGEMQELLVGQQDWTLAVALPVVGPPLDGAEMDANLYLNG